MRRFLTVVQVLVFCGSQLMVSVYAMQKPFDDQEQHSVVRMRKRGSYTEMQDPSLEKFSAIVGAQQLLVSDTLDDDERVRTRAVLHDYVAMDESDGENSAVLTDMQELPALSDGDKQDNRAAVQEAALPVPSDQCVLIQEPGASTVQSFHIKPRPQLTVDTSRRDEPVAQLGVPVSIVSRTRDYCKKFWDWVISSNANDSLPAREVKQEGEDILSASSDDSEYADHVQ